MFGLLWGIGTRPQWLVDYFPIIFSGMLAAIVCVVAYWMRVSHFYIHAALIFLGAVFHKWLGIKWEYGFIGAGSIIVLIGLGYLINFLRRYPRMVGEESGEDR
jgi:small neutral amino acid transporter SnatA (MarC family)